MAPEATAVRSVTATSSVAVDRGSEKPQNFFSQRRICQRVLWHDAPGLSAGGEALSNGRVRGWCAVENQQCLNCTGAAWPNGSGSSVIFRAATALARCAKGWKQGTPVSDSAAPAPTLRHRKTIAPTAVPAEQSGRSTGRHQGIVLLAELARLFVNLVRVHIFAITTAITSTPTMTPGSSNRYRCTNQQFPSHKPPPGNRTMNPAFPAAPH